MICRLKLSLLFIFILKLYSFSQSNISYEVFNSIMTVDSIEVNNNVYYLYNYSVNNRESIINGLEFYFIKIPLEYISLKILNIADKGDIKKIYESQNTTKESILVSGGFWGYNQKYQEISLGLVVSNKKKISNKIKWKSGGFLFSVNDSIGILPILHNDNLFFDEALQSKPILVKNSRNDIFSDDRNYFDRICIGISNDNELVICGIFNEKGRGLSLFEFAELLVSSQSVHVPNMKIAIAMDGGPSSHIYIPILGLHLGYSEINYVPNIINIIIK